MTRSNAAFRRRFLAWAMIVPGAAVVILAAAAITG
jgi:hypothetical protein